MRRRERLGILALRSSYTSSLKASGFLAAALSAYLIYDVPLAPTPAYRFGSSCLLQKGHSHVKQESCL